MAQWYVVQGMTCNIQKVATHRWEKRNGGRAVHEIWDFGGYSLVSPEDSMMRRTCVMCVVFVT